MRAIARSFTRLDQVTQLVNASEADAELGYMARLLALCSLPRTNPGNRLQYVRRNGPYTLYMNATGGVKLPYGNIPRLLLAYITTEAVRTQSRVLVLEDSLSEFMRKLGIYSTSGRGHTRLRNQMDRLFHASVTLTYEDEQSRRYMTSPITDAGEFWWNPKRPDDRSLWESKIELGEKFFEEIHPPPGPVTTLMRINNPPMCIGLPILPRPRNKNHTETNRPQGEGSRWLEPAALASC